MFNLVPLSRSYSTSGPYKALTEAELLLLQDGDLVSAGVSVASETLSVTYDFGARYRLSSLRYYHDSATVEIVSFYGKQGEDAAYPWVELVASATGSYLEVDLAALQDRYHLIKVVHAVSTGTAVVYEVEAYTDSTHIGFGVGGSGTLYSVDSGTDTLLPEILYVYNPDTVAHDFFVTLDAEDTDSSWLAISSTLSGTYAGLYEAGLSIADDFVWASGTFDNTVESSGTVILASGTVGYYYTPVIDISSLSGCRFFWVATISGTNEIDSSTVEGLPTVSVRLSNVAPTDGGWTSGQMSTDSVWHITSGSLAFEEYANNTILGPKSFDFFQARLQFNSSADGQTPVLLKVGVEEALKLSVPALSSVPFYVRSSASDHVSGRRSSLVVWNFELRNEEQ